MAEEYVNGSSVVFKNKNSSLPADKKEEENVYDEVKAANEINLSDGKTALTDKKGSSQCRRLICCLEILCVILLLSYLAVVVYVVINHTSEQNQFKENQESLLAASENKTTNLTVEIQQLKGQNQELKGQNQELKGQNQELKGQNQELKGQNQELKGQNQELKGQNQELKGQNQELKGQNQELKGQNQELEIQINNLTRKIQHLETNWQELNVSRAQWSVDAYCIKNNRQCQPCQDGWRHSQSQSSCYAINYAWGPRQKSWDGARENCRGKISDLAVITSQEEKIIENDYSWIKKYITGYWIGLRVKDMKWQWVDGSDLTETSWIGPPTDGHCAISVHNQGLKSVNCSDRYAWICEKRSLVL